MINKSFQCDWCDFLLKQRTAHLQVQINLSRERLVSFIFVGGIYSWMYWLLILNACSCKYADNKLVVKSLDTKKLYNMQFTTFLGAFMIMNNRYLAFLVVCNIYKKISASPRIKTTQALYSLVFRLISLSSSLPFLFPGCLLPSSFPLGLKAGLLWFTSHRSSLHLLACY